MDKWAIEVRSCDAKLANELYYRFEGDYYDCVQIHARILKTDRFASRRDYMVLFKPAAPDGEPEITGNLGFLEDEQEVKK